MNPKRILTYYIAVGVILILSEQGSLNGWLGLWLGFGPVLFLYFVVQQLQSLQESLRTIEDTALSLVKEISTLKSDIGDVKFYAQHVAEAPQK